MDNSLLSKGISEALVSDAVPEHLESYNFCVGMTPAFRLLHTLFCNDEVDTCLKLMLLFEVSRTSGRFTIERIRGAAPFLESSRVDSLVRSLKDGGWLDLRASDNSYSLSTVGLHLIALLHAADLENLSPSNALSRAAQNVAFRSTLADTEGVTAYLLDQLFVVLENQVEDAKNVLHHGRPFRMIAWSRREHRRQIETIREVLATIEAHTNDSSVHFAKVVRLHGAMQDIISHQTSINTRLRDWNLERLHSSDTGYSLSHLCESVMGIEDEAMLTALVDGGTVQPMLLGPSLATSELRVRFQGARRRLPSQREVFTYTPPEVCAAEPLGAVEVDPGTLLKARWSRLLAGRTAADPPLELNAWIERQSFSGVVYELTLLSRLGYEGGVIRLDDERLAVLRIHTDFGAGASPSGLLDALERAGALCRLESGLFSRVTLGVAPGAPAIPDEQQEESAHG